MEVANPEEFVASAAARTGVEAAIATQNSVPASDVTATLSVATGGGRRLEGRQLQANVDVAFEIQVENGAAADTMSEAISSADTAALASAVNDQLADSPDLQVTSVSSVTAEPEVSVSYTITTTDSTAAQNAETAMESASGMQASMNTAFEEAGIEGVAATVDTMVAPTMSTEMVDNPEWDDSFASGRAASAALAVAALSAAAGALY